jgi:hypothetical protein
MAEEQRSEEGAQDDEPQFHDAPFRIGGYGRLARRVRSSTFFAAPERTVLPVAFAAVVATGNAAPADVVVASPIPDSAVLAVAWGD